MINPKFISFSIVQICDLSYIHLRNFLPFYFNLKWLRNDDDDDDNDNEGDDNDD